MEKVSTLYQHFVLVLLEKCVEHNSLLDQVQRYKGNNILDSCDK